MVKSFFSVPLFIPQPRSSVPSRLQQIGLENCGHFTIFPVVVFAIAAANDCRCISFRAHRSASFSLSQ